MVIRQHVCDDARHILSDYDTANIPVDMFLISMHLSSPFKKNELLSISDLISFLLLWRMCAHSLEPGTYIAGEFTDQGKMLEADNACKVHGDSPLDQQSQSRLPATEADRAAKTNLNHLSGLFFFFNP